MNSVQVNHDARSLAALVNEIKRELKEFAAIRIELLRREVREKVGHWKTAAPLAAVGLLLLGTAYLLFTLAVVAGVAILVGNTPYRWFFSFLIVTAFWAIAGCVIAYMAKRDFKANKLIPEKTVEVLKGDKIWLQQEARNQI
jgi:Putative Actinobacterial Holin-X, holin superfamily III